MSIRKLKPYQDTNSFLESLNEFVFDIKHTCLLTKKEINLLIDSGIFTYLDTDVNLYDLHTFNTIRCSFHSEFALSGQLNNQLLNLYFRPLKNKNNELVYLLFIKAFYIIKNDNQTLGSINNVYPSLLSYNSKGTLNYMFSKPTKDTIGCYHFENSSVFSGTRYDTINYKKFKSHNKRFSLSFISYNSKKVYEVSFHINNSYIGFKELEVIIPDISSYSFSKIVKIEDTIAPEQLTLLEMLYI